MVKHQFTGGRSPEAPFSMSGGGGEALHSPFQDPPTDDPFLVLGPNDSYLRKGRIADPHLAAIQNIMIPGILDIGEHSTWITPMIGLRQAKTAQPFAAGQPGQVFPALFLAAIFIDGEHDQGALDRSRTTDPAITPFQFLHHKAVADIVQSAPSVLFGHGRPKTPQFPQLPDDMLRKLSFL